VPAWMGAIDAPVAALYGLPWSWLVEAVFSTAVQLAVGAALYDAAWHGLRRGQPNMQLLVALGTSAAWVYSLLAMALAARAGGAGGGGGGMEAGYHVYFETSALIITFVCLGGWVGVCFFLRAGVVCF